MTSTYVPVRRALLSVSDKTGLVDLAHALHAHGVELVSTGGSARLIQDGGLPVTPVESITKSPEMLGGRVKTLHPLIHGPILADRGRSDHMETLGAIGALPIDLIVVNLYPFERTSAEPDVTHANAVEQIDIGGPTMLRAGAKNADAVAVVCDPSQYLELLEELEANDGATSLDLRRRLALAAFERTARYDTAIVHYLRDKGIPRTHTPEDRDDSAEAISLHARRTATLRYGENPHQSASVYRTDEPGPLSLVDAERLAGKPLSYNNLNDVAGALNVVIDLKRVAPSRCGATVVKHTNPCGMALARTAASATTAALRGDQTAAYGGILTLNTELDDETADGIIEHAGFLEVVAAPSVTPAALNKLTERWANLRVLSLGNLDEHAPAPRQFKQIPGGLLVQQADQALPTPSGWTQAAGEETAHHASVLAFIAVKHLTSNAIAIAAADPDGDLSALVGAGAGQMDRVAACRIAAEKAGARAAGAVAASDAFFPFADGPEVLINAGVASIIQPGGSKRDQDTIDLCADRGVCLHLTGIRTFRH